MDERTAMMGLGIGPKTRACGNQGMAEMIAKTMTVVLEKMHTYIGAYDQGRSRLWAERLARDNFCLDDVKTAANHIVETWKEKHSPSYAVFKDFLPRTHKQTDETPDAQRQAEQLREDTDRRMRIFAEKVGADSLTEYLRTWWSVIYGGCPDSYGLSLSFFVPVFLQDLEAADWNISALGARCESEQTDGPSQLPL